MRSQSKVYFFMEGVRVSLGAYSRLEKIVSQIFKGEGKKLNTLNYIFCSDHRLRQINKEYLKHDYFTDIITFDLSETATEISGDIYISADRVRDNAHKLDIPVREEFARVIVHGALHLCGFGDKTTNEKSEMRKMEDFYLKKAKF